MTPYRAIKELISRGDIAQLGGGHVLVSELSPELLMFLSSFETEFEDDEDEDFDEDDFVCETSEQRVCGGAVK